MSQAINNIKNEAQSQEWVDVVQRFKEQIDRTEYQRRLVSILCQVQIGTAERRENGDWGEISGVEFF